MQIKIKEEDIKWYCNIAPSFGKVIHIIAEEIAKNNYKFPYETKIHFLDEAKKSIPVEKIYFPFEKQKNSLNEYFNNEICISINKCVAHGKSFTKEYKKGDIVKIDCGIAAKAPSGRMMYFDSAMTVLYGGVGKKEKLDPLIIAPALAIDKMLKLRGKINTSQLSEITQNLGEELNYNIVNTLCGHSIGYKLHDSVKITNLISQEASVDLLQGTLICPEPMYVKNGYGYAASCYIDSNGWSVICEDISSHWETVLYYDGNKLIDVVGIISPK